MKKKQKKWKPNEFGWKINQKLNKLLKDNRIKI